MPPSICFVHFTESGIIAHESVDEPSEILLHVVPPPTPCAMGHLEIGLWCIGLGIDVASDIAERGDTLPLVFRTLPYGVGPPISALGALPLGER